MVRFVVMDVRASSSAASAETLNTVASVSFLGVL